MVLLFILSGFCSAQNQDVIEISGGNLIPILEQSDYYIDQSGTIEPENISDNLHLFKRNNQARLTLGKQACPVWIRVQLQNTGKPQKYWLGVYSQLDSLWVYRKEGADLKLEGISSYALSPRQRNPKNPVRFHLAVFDLDKDEKLDLFLKATNKRHFSNIYADFTTPEGNLQWEVGFFWKQGFFIGGFFVGLILTLIFGFYSRKKLFLVYSFYLLFSCLIILQEELNIAVFNCNWLYAVLYRMNTIFLLPINIGLHLFILKEITGLENLNSRLAFWLDRISMFFVASGLLLSLYYFIRHDYLGFQNPYFSFVWDSTQLFVILAVFVSAAVVFYYFMKVRKYILAVPFSIFLLVFNPVVYYFNYSKFIDFYEITYPNYYYYFLVLEIFLLGVIIAVQYRNTQKLNLGVLEQKLEIEKNYTKLIIEQEQKIRASIIDSQEQLLRDLSQDLHDDVGQKLSVINFSIENLKLTGKVTNQVDGIQDLVLKISKSLRDLSHWLNDFDIRNTSFEELIQNEVLLLNNSVSIVFKINFQ